MILLITTSVDQTADMVVARLPADRLFRFNADLLAEYRVEFTPGRFRLRDPLGREVRDDTVTACYFRKLDWPFVLDVPAGGSPENWLRRHQAHFAHELYDWFRGTPRIVLELGARHELRKIAQMNLAAGFFDVPAYFAGVSEAIRDLPYAADAVSKNLANTFVQDFKGHRVSPVDTRRLDPAFPWFLQTRAAAASDITVAYVNGLTFAYECPRDDSEVDCRTIAKLTRWTPTRLAPAETEAVVGFMQKADLRFGRLDFLRGYDGRLHFLEVNTNGQWGWLDPKGDTGLLDAIVGEILAVDRRNRTAPTRS